MRDTPKTLVKSFTGYSFGVFISRVSGMCRDIALSFFFGTGAEIALFMMSYRFANLMRRMLAESPLSSSFVPVFENQKSVSFEEGSKLFRDLFFSLAVIVTGVVAVSIGALWTLSQLFFMNPSTLEIFHLTEVMFPSLLFICLYGLCSTFLQCERQFFLPAVAPVALNITWIVVACFAATFELKVAMRVLSYGVVLAFFMQWIVVMPRVLKALPSLRFLDCRLFHSSLKPLVKPFFLGILGVGATQINIALDSVFARFADLEGPAFLWYSVRIEQVPIALFGVAISTAILPALTRAIQGGDRPRMLALLQQGFRQTFSLMTFSMFGLLALGYLAITLVFGRGEFDYHSVSETTRCLWAYGLGLIPHGLMLILISTFYAHKDFKRPMQGAIFSVAFNSLLNAIMVFGLHWGATSIALGTSLTSLFNYLYLKKFAKEIIEEKIATYSFYFKTLLCGATAFGVVAFLQYHALFQKQSLLTFKTALSALSIFSVIYIGIYCLMEKLCKCEEILKLIKTRFFK